MMPEDAFQTLTNMFIHDGTIKRRPAAKQLSSVYASGIWDRVKINIGTTDVSGDLAATVVLGATAIGQQFSVLGTIFTVVLANGAMLVSPAGAAGTFNVTTKTVTITGATPNSTVYFYPSSLIIGFANYFGEEIRLFAFDSQFAYKYGATGFEKIDLAPIDQVFNAGTSTRIRSENFDGNIAGEPALFITNTIDNIRYYTTATPVFTKFIPNTIDPLVTPNTYVASCNDIIAFNGRLLLLGTTEFENTVIAVGHYNRIRYSEYGNALSADSWYQAPEVTNKGGFIDLPIGEVIKSAEILDNRLIMFTSRTIYELVPTGNYREPFKVELIDNTYGNESTNVVEFDNQLLFVNNYGIYSYDGRSTKKINIQLNDSFDSYEYRYGNIYKDESLNVIYILMSKTINNKFPERILMYNYGNNTYSLIDDIATAMGSLYETFGPISVGYPIVPLTIIGNHRGYVRYLKIDSYKNDPSQPLISINRLDAQNIQLLIINHKLDRFKTSDYIRIENSTLAGLNGSYIVEEAITDDLIKVKNDIVNTANYLGDGVISRIDQISIVTKQFNPYMKQGFGTCVNKIAFNVNRTTASGVYTVTGLPNTSTIERWDFDHYVGSRLLETQAYALIPTEASQDRVWHHVYLQTRAESVAFIIYFKDDQILDDSYPYQELTINAIMLYTDPAKCI